MITKQYRLTFVVVIISTILFTYGCSTKTQLGPDTEPPLRTVENTVDSETKSRIAIYDPLEGFNRGSYRFNYYLDKYFLLPVVNGYEFIMPDYCEDRVSDFFDNIGEIRNFVNAALQLKPMKMAITTCRFMFNTTFGIGGLWDIAELGDLHEQREDFGQTLGHYGLGSGPYLVLPVFGPSSFRDTTGIVTDSLIFSSIDPLNFDNNNVEVPFYVLQSIDTRKRQVFRYYGTGNPFEYELVRFLYTKKREIEIAD